MRTLFVTILVALVVVTAIAPDAMGVASKISKERVYHNERHHTGSESAVRALAFPWPFGRSEDARNAQSEDFKRQLRDTGMIRTSSILFASASADLKRESRQVLDDIGRLLAERPDLRIEIAGYTDSRASAHSNRDLSRRRAEAVKKYLVEEFPAIKAENLKAVGYGEANPVASNETRAGRKKNRRVEFKILD